MVHSEHVINRFALSIPPPLKIILLAFLGILGGLALGGIVGYLDPEYIYRKDFIQEYLLAKATLYDIYPYSRVSDLATQLMGPLPNTVFPHPTPHPPAVGLLFLPLGFLTYHHAVLVWFAIQLACIVFSAYVILQSVQRPPKVLLVVVLSLMATAWSPFSQDLILGQLMTLQLALLVGAWQMLRAGKAVRGGIFVGTAVAVKLIAWPLVLLLIVRRCWKAAAAAGGVIFAANGAAALVMGGNTVFDYYLRVGTQVSSLYRAHAANFSVWTLGWRAFSGTDSPVLCGVTALPAVNAQWLAPYIALIPPLAFMIWGLFWTSRTGRENFDGSFAVQTCVCILISPVAWCCYLTLLVIPLTFVIKSLFQLRFPKFETNLVVVVAILLLIPPNTLTDLMVTLGAPSAADACRPAVPVLLTTISLIPLIATLGVLYLVLRLTPRKRDAV